MSFVNNSSSTGINFIGSTTESARIGKPTPTSAVPQGPATASLTDQVAQSTGPQGQARPVSFLDDSPQLLQFHQYLNSGKFDDLEALIGSMSVTDLKKLQLSVQDIAKIAEGLGKGSLTADLPLVGSYTDSEQNAVKRLINSSTHLSVNQRIFLLKDNIGPGAVLEFVQKARPEELKQLSSANRQMALSVLDPGSSIWGTVSGATTELVTRRYQGQKRPEDQLAGQILRSAKNETELRSLLAQLNQFSRDDAVFYYVLSLSPKELDALSDAMKKELLQHLVDTGIQLPLIHIDLNSIANLDETLKMTFSEHVGAARLLYQALTPKAQQSAEVQQIVAKSDELLKELSQLQAAIEKDKQAASLTQEKIDAYLAQALALKQKLAGNPELQQKAQALLDTLTALQKDLRKAASQEVVVVQDLKQTRSSIQRAKGALSNAQKALNELKTTLPQTQSRLQAQETQMLALYQRLLQTRQQFTAVEPRYTQLLQDMEAALQNPRTQKGKLTQLESLNQQLKQMETQLTQQNQAAQALMSEIHSLSESLEQNKQAYNREAETLNQGRKALQDNQAELNRSLAIYTTQVRQLETGLVQAKKQMQNLQSAGAPTSVTADLQKEIEQLEKEIATHRSALEGIQKDYSQYVLPEAEKIEVAAAQMNTERTALTPVLQAAENSAEATGGVFQVFVDTYDYLKDKVSQVVAQTQSFVSDWSQRLSQGGSISRADIQAFRAGFSSKMQDLEAQLQEAQKPGAPAELRAELESQIVTLKALNATVTQLESSIQKAESITQSAQETLGQLETQKAQFEAELRAAKEAIELSALSIAGYEQKISEIQNRISAFQVELSGFDAQISAVLAELDKTQSYAKKMQESYGKGLLGANELGQLLQANQERQQALKFTLNQLYQDAGRIQGQLENQVKTLTQQTASLADEKEKMDQAVARAETLRNQLKENHMQNNALILQVKQELQHLPAQAHDFPALKDKVSKVENLVHQLTLKNQATETLIEKVNQTVLSALPLNQQFKAANQALSSLSVQSSQLQAQKLPKLLTSLDAVNRQFVILSQKSQAASDAVLSFEQAFKGGGQPLKIQDAQAQIERLMQQEGLTSSAVAKLAQLKADLASMTQAFQSANLELNRHLRVHADHSQVYSQAYNANAAVRTQLTELKTQIDAAEAELGAGKQEMLQLQRQLLNMRQTLGITSADYQAHLQRYEALLKRGNNLSAKEIAELEQLEQKLSQLESAHANSNFIKERLMGLNSLKSRINQQMASLKQKTQRLLEMRERLVGSTGNLQLSQEWLVKKRAEFQRQRGNLAAHLAYIGTLLENGPTADLLELRDKLQAELNVTDQLIWQYDQELQKTDQDLANSTQLLAEIGLTLEQARTIQENLAMLVFQMDDLIRQGEDLLADYQTFEKDIQALKEQITESKKILQPEQPYVPQSQGQSTASAVTDSGKENKGSPLNAMQKLLGQGLSGLMRQRQDANLEREQAHQAKREKMLKALEQQLSESRQFDHAWKAKIQQQAQLEKITEQMIQAAYRGQIAMSGINIVGLIEKQALESSEMT